VRCAGTRQGERLENEWIRVREEDSEWEDERQETERKIEEEGLRA